MLSLPFLDLPLPFHFRSLTVHRLPTDFPLTFRCVSTTYPQVCRGRMAILPLLPSRRSCRHRPGRHSREVAADRPFDCSRIDRLCGTPRSFSENVMILTKSHPTASAKVLMHTVALSRPGRSTPHSALGGNTRCTYRVRAWCRITMPNPRHTSSATMRHPPTCHWCRTRLHNYRPRHREVHHVYIYAAPGSHPPGWSPVSVHSSPAQRGAYTKASGRQPRHPPALDPCCPLGP